MKPFALAGIVLALCCAASASRAVDLGKLTVLYVGEPPTSTRAKQVTAFLEKNVARVEAVNRHGFQPKQATEFDVVLLDWPQTGATEQERQQPSPLGPRSAWTKPTVLLGSAGLNLAVVWKVRGGSG
jgi:hypothetical protein